jgi:hypothetical protein
MNVEIPANNDRLPDPIVKRSHHRSRTMTKITLVTGGSRGLGRNTALSIARYGGDVVLPYQSRGEDAQAALAEIQAVGRKAIAFHSTPAMLPLCALRRPSAYGSGR